MPLQGGSDTWWKNELRDGLCIALWADAAARRNDMQGAGATQGIDRRATLALLSKKLLPTEVGTLRRIISGSLRLQKRLHDAVLVASPCCPFCSMCDETVRHCFWDERDAGGRRGAWERYPHALHPHPLKGAG